MLAGKSFHQAILKTRNEFRNFVTEKLVPRQHKYIEALENKYVQPSSNLKYNDSKPKWHKLAKAIQQQNSGFNHPSQSGHLLLK